jgi:hypothetical protein
VRPLTVGDAAITFLEVASIAAFRSGGGALSETDAALTAAARNPDAYSVFFEAPINGASRAAHRASANELLASQLRNDPEFAAAFDRAFGTDVLQHMESGSSLLNPPGTVWHHPFDNSGSLQLLTESEHTSPLLQSVLHPGGIGGYGKFFNGP